MNEPGERIVVERTLTQDDFDRFAELSGDNNPIHVDPAFSAKTRFGRTVSHGLLLASILRGLVDRLVPGGRQVSQRLKFTAPTYAGDPMLFSVAIESNKGGLVSISMSSVRAEDGVVTCEGAAVVRGGD